jgi:hypothetical protein
MPPVCDIGLRGYRFLRSESNQQVLVHLELEREPDCQLRSGTWRCNDEVTLSELEERSGLDFGRLKDFDVLAAQPIQKSVLIGARLRLPLTGVRDTVLWAP